MKSIFWSSNQQSNLTKFITLSLITCKLIGRMTSVFDLESNSMKFIILFSCFLLFLSLQVHAQDPILIECSNPENYTSNGQFQTNLDLLLSSLGSNGAQDGFFFNEVGNGSDTVYGLVQCRGDASREYCQTCLNNVTVDIIPRCPNKMDATLQYGDCILRYSNKRFFSQRDNSSRRGAFYNIANISDADIDRFNQRLAGLINNLSSAAASRPDRYDFGSTEYASFKKIYGMVLCNRDLSPTICQQCLQSLISYIPDCCNSKQGAYIFSTTCDIRFETYPFIENEPVSLPPPPPPVSTLPPQTTNNTNNTERGYETGKGKSTNVAIIVLPVFASILLLSICGLFTSKRIVKNRRKTKPDENYEQELGTTESLQFNFKTIREATYNFSDANKLGKGGFGIVYKGTLLDGQEIAVMRLSSNSGQGVEEFKNEVLLIVKLQHRNLVKLLGFCLERNEKLLIYEFASNASLDHYLFDPTKCTYLSWERRHKIIGGIARGLLYLHEDSRHRIIHRDLKAGNVLLDEHMEPKISDFGMARLFKVDQTQGSTARIVGTYGYMAPEYAMHGQFSVKSDVFSFGVLVLEIITGQKNKVFFQSKHAEDLLSYAWRHWGEGRALELIEPALKGQYSVSEVMRNIHIALLCVQEDASLRPRMATVVHMLETESVTLASPSTPAFFVNSREHMNNGESGEDSAKLHSVNEVTLTEMLPR